MFKRKTGTDSKKLFASPGKKLSRAAVRALEAASHRRCISDPGHQSADDCPFCRLEPTRYGDWENRGKCADF